MPKKPSYEELLARVRELELVEKELVRSEQRYRFLMKATTSIYWTTDASGGFVVPQPSWEKFTGQPWPEHQGFGWTNMIHSDDVDRILEGWGKATRTLSMYETWGRVWSAQLEQYRDFEVRAVPIMDADGSLCEWAGFIIDITERKQAEREVVREARLRTNLLDNIPDCIALILKKETHEIVAANKYAHEAGAVFGKTCFEACFGTKEVCPFCMAPELWASGEQQRLEVEYQGTWYDSIWMDLSDDLYVRYIFDITHRKNAEKALRESEARLKRMIQKSPLPMVITDLHQEIHYLNEKFTQLFGYTLDDLQTVEQWWVAAFPDPSYRKTVRTTWDKAFEKAAADKTDIQMQKWDIIIKSGARRICEFHMVPLGDVRLIVIQDITAKQQNEERLRQAQKMESIGNLAGGIAHDFNNILSPIIGMAEMLMEDLPPDSMEYDNSLEIFLAGKRGSDLVNQILSFSRRTEQKKIPTQLQHVISEVLKLSRSTIPTSTEIIKDIQSDCGPIMADPTQMHQIAINLITNAHHAVELEGGHITVQLVEKALGADDLVNLHLVPGRYALLSVSDDGLGMSKEMISNIFEPYYTTKETGKGTGLGLAVAYGLVKEHHGEITVTSAIGEGTTFTVYLPILEGAEAPKQKKTPEGDITGTERILIVDDEAPIVKLQRQIFDRLGYQVTTCLDSLEALKVFEADPDAFDLVITDMAMPNMTGDMFTRKLLAVRPELPIIICTGFSERISEQKAQALGAKGFVMKPIVTSVLAQMVRNVLDGS